MKRIRRYLKNLLYPSLLWLAGFLVLPVPAHAAFFLGAAAVAAIAYAVLYIFSYVGGIFFAFNAYIVAWFINFNVSLPTDISGGSSLIKIGWTIMRDVANLGFVLVIIVIAFATIIRFKTYGAQKLLPKLIAAAIVVNFSLTIGIVFINFGNILTNYFFSQITTTSGQQGKGITGSLPGSAVVDALSAAFDPQNLFVEPADPEPIDPEDEVGGITQFGSRILIDIASLFFAVIFTFLGAFTLLVFAFMLLVRYIYLTILLIISPIIWLFWVIPSLEGMFSQWWKKFMEWVFFAPAVSFFFYLTLLSVKTMASGQAAVSPEAFFKNGMRGALMAQGAKMMVLIGLLIGGMIIAQKFGITGASFAMKTMQGAAAGVGTGLRKYAGNKVTRGWELAKGGTIGKKIQDLTQKAGDTKVGKAWKWMNKPTLAVGGGMGGMFGTEAETKSVSATKSILSGMKEGSGLFPAKKEKPEKLSRAELRKKSKKLKAEVKRLGGPEKAREQYEEVADTDHELEKRISMDVELGMKWKMDEMESTMSTTGDDQLTTEEKAKRATERETYKKAGFDPNDSSKKGQLQNRKVAYEAYKKEQEGKLNDKNAKESEKLEYADNIKMVGDLIDKIEEAIAKIDKREKESGGGGKPKIEVVSGDVGEKKEEPKKHNI